MSRYCSELDSTPILSAAEHWRAHGLHSNGSIFSTAALWTLDNLHSIDRYFVNALTEEEGTFLEKLKHQMEPADPPAKQLLAEMVWVMLLCPSNITPATKRDQIRTIWDWSTSPLADSPWLQDEVLAGIGGAGQGFNQNRWRELVFFVRFMLEVKKVSEVERNNILNEPWEMAGWIAQIPEANSRQLRHMILYLLFPDSFERIFGSGDRKEIVGRLSEIDNLDVNTLPQLKLDQELLSIRRALESRYGTNEIDFYNPPVAPLWRSGGFERFTKDIKREHVIRALEEIDQDTIPADARSTTYDLIEGVKRYPPKLVLSLASKHATGEQFERSLFSGGEASPAFALLRKLGFHIERKDFVSKLLETFLGQAAAADDLSTKAYPKNYRGLQVSVSFGKGNFGKIPWISFLGYGQRTSEGIYPVYLFYREIGILILAYGVSETTAPTASWKQLDGVSTVKEYLKQRFSTAPDRYGDSWVYAAYKIPDDIQADRVTADLDALIAKYIAQFSKAGEVPVADVPVTVSPETLRPAQLSPPPFTIDQALEGLFIERERFRAILELWERKKNLILQGPPGVGKSFFCRRLAYALMHEQAPERVGAIQFHQTYSYEDFVQGYRPSPNGFKLRDGLFFQFCDRARDDKDRNYVFIIDEINRGNLSKILGELMMLIEADKRKAEYAIPLSYADGMEDRFFVPPNVFLLGLMNTADRSLAVVDYALRRRFAFVNLDPGFGTSQFREHMIRIGANDGLAIRIIERMSKLNLAIAKDTTNLGPGFCIGHSFFCQKPLNRPADDAWYRTIVETEISPLLGEYWFDQPSVAEGWKRALLEP